MVFALLLLSVLCFSLCIAHFARQNLLIPVRDYNHNLDNMKVILTLHIAFPGFAFGYAEASGSAMPLPSTLLCRLLCGKSSERYYAPRQSLLNKFFTSN